MVKIVSVFGIFLAFIAINVIAGLIVYTAIYNAKIKRRLAQGITTGKQWPQPKNIVLIILIVALSLVCVVSVINGFGNLQQSPVNMNNIGYVEAHLSYELQDSHFEHYIDAYKTGELAGYTLTEATEDEFHYMYFRSESYFDLLHPSFVLFLEYTGEEDYRGYIDSSVISYGTEFGTSALNCGETSTYFCVVGNVDHIGGHDVTYELCLYNTEADAFEEFDRITSSENDNEPIENAKKSITFTTTEDSVLICK